MDGVQSVGVGDGKVMGRKGKRKVECSTHVVTSFSPNGGLERT